MDPELGNIPFGEDSIPGQTDSAEGVLAVAQLVEQQQKEQERQQEKKPQTAKDEIYKDYQQKIDPWEMNLVDQDLYEIRRRREVERKKENFDVVVVASLIDRVPNLAGLSRTCEIFGATCLTVPQISVVDDPNFRNISMTSEKWLDIIEVKADDLEHFLSKKRIEGYRVVAIEQSSHSHSLLYYEFPRQCCLVLGNEKEGVPAEILHLVDDCIEIPQFGMIQSLNVHVSGSLVLWEARKQERLSNANPGLLA